MATITSLIERVRLELGDLGKSFVEQFMADGTTNRFKIDYAPLDGESVVVSKNGTDISNATWVEESTGVIITETVPADGDTITVSGTYYRYFKTPELEMIVNNALNEHVANHTDSTGRSLSLANLPAVEEYPVALYATTLALYTLATDAAFDIDISAPDGVNIPRSERYRQLMEMLQTRQNQYRELCSLLGIGLYTIDVLTLRRISKATGRYVPAYEPQEVDDRSYPERVRLPKPTYGSKPVPWETDAGALSSYQGRAFTTTVPFTGDYFGKTFVARLLPQRGSVISNQYFELNVIDVAARDISAVSRTSGQTTATITATAHGFTVGKSVQISGINTEFDKIWTVVSVPNTNTFTITTTATTTVALTNQTGVVSPTGEKSYTATLSLTADQTLRIPERTYWSVQITNPDVESAVPFEVIGGDFFTARVSTVVI